MATEYDTDSCRDNLKQAAASSDLVSAMFRDAHPHCCIVETLQFTAPWGVRVGARAAAVYYILHGRCRVEVTGVGEPVCLVAGDFAAVMPGHEHFLRCNSGDPVVPLEQVLEINAIRAQREVAPNREKCSTRLVYSSLLFEQRHVALLLCSLPPVIVVPAADGTDTPWLKQLLGLMIRECEDRQAGSQSVVAHLAQVLFIHAVRRCVNMRSNGAGRGLSSLIDPDIGVALKLMHTSLESPWTVATLARRVCMSRSVFASRFKGLLATSPMQYLMECRMQKACELLAEGRQGIKQIAARVGYSAKGSFGGAFKRWSGKSPAEYRRLLRADAARRDSGPAVR